MVGVVGGADLVADRAGGLVDPAGDVGAGLGLTALGHRLVDGATAMHGRALLVEALVLAAAAEHLHPGVDAGLEVEDHGVVGMADEDGVTLDRAELDEPRLDAEAVEPVGQEAHGLVVAEVRLAHPALRLRAADAPAFGRTR